MQDGIINFEFLNYELGNLRIWKFENVRIGRTIDLFTFHFLLFTFYLADFSICNLDQHFQPIFCLKTSLICPSK
jgi:hypothetical protein